MKRIQRSREKGWKQPKGCRFVGRGTPWGNPFIVGEYDERWGLVTQDLAVSLFSQQVDLIALRHGMTTEKWLEPLRQYEMLSCFCSLDERCHADVLIELLEKPKPKMYQMRLL